MLDPVKATNAELLGMPEVKEVNKVDATQALFGKTSLNP
jgi:hypothetical protein